MDANIDAINVADRFGIQAERTINYESDSIGTQLNYNVLSDALSAVRKSKSRAETSAELNECGAPIVNDYKKRHRFHRFGKH